MESAQPLLTIPKPYIDPPGGFNPDILCFLGSISLLALGAAVYWIGDLPHGICLGTNVLALHIAGGLIHDASHKSVHRNPIINAMVGHGCALVLGFAFPVFTRVHLAHHAHVNDPDNDPDHFVSTSGPIWLIAVRFFYHEVYFFQRRLWRKFELLEWFLSRLFLVVFILLGVKFGFVDYLVRYWFPAALIVGLMEGIFFDYLPHRPFHERNRWKNARVYANPMMNWLILGQNYHLVHHLWPSIPWYQYQPSYYLVKPYLESHNCPLSTGILQDKANFWNFIYDIFIGVRFHGAKSPKTHQTDHQLSHESIAQQAISPDRITPQIVVSEEVISEEVMAVLHQLTTAEKKDSETLLTGSK